MTSSAGRKQSPHIILLFKSLAILNHFPPCNGMYGLVILSQAIDWPNKIVLCYSLTFSTCRAQSLKRKRAATTDDEDDAPKQISKKAKGGAQLDVDTEALGKEEEVTGYSLYRAGQKEQLERS